MQNSINLHIYYYEKKKPVFRPFEIGSHSVTLASLELVMQTRLALDFQQSYLYYTNAGITTICHCAQS